MKKNLLSLLAFATFAIVVHAQAIIPNAGFETWASPGFGAPAEPTGWISGNIFNNSFYLANSGLVFCDSAGAPNNYQGNYSMKLTTRTLVTNPSPSTVPNTFGYCLTGNVLLTSPYIRPGYSSQQRPVSFSYAVKYAPVGTDSAFCLIAVTHWNGSTRDTVAAGLDFINAPIAAYTVRNVSLVYNPTFASTIPDSICIWFSPSSFVTPNVGSVMYVDACSFTGYNGINEATQNNGVNIYPNPSSSLTNFDVTSENANNVVVYDMTGREVTSSIILNKKATINSSNLAEGVYSYSIVGKQGEVISRGKFSVAQ